MGKSQAARERYRLKRKQGQEWIVAWKEKAYCIRCGESHPGCLDFHHVDPAQKEFNIGAGINRKYTLPRIMKEIDKCEALCSNCHRIHHWEENRKVTMPPILFFVRRYWLYAWAPLKYLATRITRKRVKPAVP